MLPRRPLCVAALVLALVLALAAVVSTASADEPIEVALTADDSVGDAFDPLSFLPASALDSLSEQTVFERGLVQWPAGVLDSAPAPAGGKGKGSAAAKKSDFTRNPLSGRDVLRQHRTFSKAHVSTRQFASGDVLGYVTPWNGKGYEVSRVFARKLTYAAPVWFQVALTLRAPSAEQKARNAHNAKGKVVIAVRGAHDVNRKWMADVRAANPQVKVTPRFMVEAETPELMARLVSSPKLQRVFVKRVAAALNEFGFDGVVLECTDAWPRLHQLDAASGQTGAPHALRAKLNAFVAFVAAQLHAMSIPRELVLVIPPARGSPTSSALDSLWFGARDFAALHTAVDRFSLMTYDYSSGSGNAGPSAPLAWVEFSLQTLFAADPTFVSRADVTGKVLLGLPFYGHDYAANRETKAVVHHDLVRLLKATKANFFWDDTSKEHFFRYRDTTTPAQPAAAAAEAEAAADAPAAAPTANNGEHLVFYPTLHFLDIRMRLAKRYGVGLSIWELGQGLDYFADLL